MCSWKTTLILLISQTFSFFSQLDEPNTENNTGRCIWWWKYTPLLTRNTSCSWKIWCILKDMLTSQIKLLRKVTFFTGRVAEDHHVKMKLDPKFLVEIGRCFPDAFPDPCNINISMMPFITGWYHFEEFKLPSFWDRK